ncbi:MAG: tetratricopeptide repeat protein [Fuerstiella sp.]|nr:tetratricopeptide repeat protein [Fuerstiella sp.]
MLRDMVEADRSCTTAVAVALGVVLFVGTLCAYSPAMQAGFIWDDDDHITLNKTLHESNGLRRIWLEPTSIPQYYPLVHTVFRIEYSFWQLDAQPYHVTNIVIHALSVLLLWSLLRRLRIPGAWMAAAVFAVHPVHVESVAWITERKNLMSCFFYLASANIFLRWYGVTEDSALQGKNYVWYGVSLLLFLCAILSKTVAGSLPAALLLVIYWKRGRTTARDIAFVVPMFVMAAPLGLTTAWLERHHVGAMGADWDYSTSERLLIAGRAAWFYSFKLIWPVNLTFIYPRWQLDTGNLIQWLYPGGVAVLLVVLWSSRKRIGRGPIVAALFFGGTLFPALGFFNVFPMRYSFVADHFQYPASIGLIVLLVAGGRTMVAASGRLKNLATISAVAVLSILASLCWQRCHVYRDIEQLWTDTISRNPDCWMARANLADEHVRQGRLYSALKQYQIAWQQLGTSGLREAPEFTRIQNNWGMTLGSLNRSPEAIPHFQMAIRHAPDNVLAHANLGNCMEIMQQFNEAKSNYQRALRINPNSSIAHGHLGRLLLLQGETGRATTHLQTAVRLDPDHNEARALLDQMRAETE